MLLNSNPDAKNGLEHFWNVKYNILGDNDKINMSQTLESDKLQNLAVTLNLCL